MESFIRDHIVNYKESNDLFNCDQQGFRKGHSCLCDTLDEGSGVDTIYLDFKKADQ